MMAACPFRNRETGASGFAAGFRKCSGAIRQAGIWIREEGCQLVNHKRLSSPIPITRDPRWRIMGRYKDVPELLDKLMEESGKTERWITVNEFRTYYNLDEFSSPAISGFLRRIYQGPFFSFRYRVERIEKITIQKPHTRIIKRYLVTRRPNARQKNPELCDMKIIGDDVRVSEKG
jgi:hypothetical protein